MRKLLATVRRRLANAWAALRGAELEPDAPAIHVDPDAVRHTMGVLGFLLSLEHGGPWAVESHGESCCEGPCPRKAS